MDTYTFRRSSWRWMRDSGVYGETRRHWNKQVRGHGAEGCNVAVQKKRHQGTPITPSVDHHQRRHSIFYSQFDTRPSCHTLKQVQSDRAWDSSGRRNSNWYFAKIRIFSIRKHVSCFCIWHSQLYNIRKYHSGGEIRSIVEAYCSSLHMLTRIPIPCVTHLVRYRRISNC